MDKYRDTKISRSSLPESVKMQLWGRSAARCVLCSELLISENHFWHHISTGELAHIVAASSGPKAPRGNSPLNENERAQEENILLLCHSCHRVIDSEEHRNKYTIDFLKARKAEHERRVREVTNFPTLRPATVLSLQGDVRGSFSRATPDQISTALLHSGLTGLGADTRNGRLDIQLDQSADEEWFWQAAQAKIKRTMRQINEAIAGEDTHVIAVFAIAPIPVLAYLGSQLDDKTEIALFPHQRVDNASAWAWSMAGLPPKRFRVSCETESSEVEDLVVIMNISGTIDRSRIPDALVDSPILIIEPYDEIPHSDIIGSIDTLNEFSATWRVALATIEAKWPKMQRIHIIAAVPITAAVAIGRYRMRDIHPVFVLYQRTDDNTYEKAMEISE